MQQAASLKIVCEDMLVAARRSQGRVKEASISIAMQQGPRLNH